MLKKKKEASPSTPPLVDIKMKRASIEHLSAILPLHRSGRFFILKSKVLAEVRETPENQFVIIPFRKEIADDLRERKLVALALYKSLQALGWVVRWDVSLTKLIIARKAQVQEIKGGSKNGH